MKIEIKAIPLIHPATICLVGTIYNHKPNYTTIGDIAVAGINPPLIMISINENHCCMSHINKQKSFSINIPTQDMLEKVDFCGVHSGHLVDKSKIFKTEYIDGIPTIQNSPISIVVEEEKRIKIEHRIILACRVKKTMIDTAIQQKDKINLDSIKSILYGMNNSYYTVGEVIGKGYQKGVKVRKK